MASRLKALFLALKGRLKIVERNHETVPMKLFCTQSDNRNGTSPEWDENKCSVVNDIRDRI